MFIADCGCRFCKEGCMDVGELSLIRFETIEAKFSGKPYRTSVAYISTIDDRLIQLPFEFK